MLNGRYYLYDGEANEVSWLKSQDDFLKCLIDFDELESVVLPESITRISDGLFFNCRGLKSIKIPSGVISIEDMAFLGCENLTDVTLPDGVKDIGERAFQDCKALTSIIIPKSVTKIGRLAFGGCKNITLFFRADKIPKGVDVLKIALKSAKIVCGYQG